MQKKREIFGGVANRVLSVFWQPARGGRSRQFALQQNAASNSFKQKKSPKQTRQALDSPQFVPCKVQHSSGTGRLRLEVQETLREVDRLRVMREEFHRSSADDNILDLARAWQETVLEMYDKYDDNVAAWASYVLNGSPFLQKRH